MPGGRDVYTAASQRRDGAREAARREGLVREAPRDGGAASAASPFGLPPRLAGGGDGGAARGGAPELRRAAGGSASGMKARPGGPPRGPGGGPEARGGGRADERPVAPAPVERVIPGDPARAWELALEVLNPYERTTILESTAFGGFAEGTLTLMIRHERYRAILREKLAEVDFVSVLPGFRRVEIKLGDEGTTGREARTVEKERRAEAARAAVETAALVKRLVTLLDGRVEIVEASMLDGGDRSMEEDKDD